MRSDGGVPQSGLAREIEPKIPEMISCYNPNYGRRYPAYASFDQSFDIGDATDCVQLVRTSRATGARG